MIVFEDVNWEIPEYSGGVVQIRTIKHDSLFGGEPVVLREHGPSERLIVGTSLPAVMYKNPRSRAVRIDGSTTIEKCQFCGDLMTRDWSCATMFLGNNMRTCDQCTSFLDSVKASDSFIIKTERCNALLMSADGLSMSIEQTMSPRVNLLISSMLLDGYAVKMAGAKPRSANSLWSYSLVLKRQRGCTMVSTRPSLMFIVNDGYPSDALDRAAVDKIDVMAFLAYERTTSSGASRRLSEFEYLSAGRQFLLKDDPREFNAIAYISPKYESYFSSEECWR